jgi:ketosteroid isomerase-like protein
MGALVAVVLALSTGARADGKADEAAIRKMMAKLETAFAKKDIKTIMALSTPDFTEKAMGQTMTAAQAKAELEQEFKNTTAVHKMEMKVSKIEFKNGTAIVNTVDASDSTMADPQGQMGKKGASHRMAMTGTGRATCVKVKGEWKVKMYEELTMKMTMDGKPFNPGGNAPPKK